MRLKMPIFFRGRFNINYQVHTKQLKNRYIILSFEAFGQDFKKVDTGKLERATNCLTIWDFQKINPKDFEFLESNAKSSQPNSSPSLNFKILDIKILRFWLCFHFQFVIYTAERGK